MKKLTKRQRRFITISILIILLTTLIILFVNTFIIKKDSTNSDINSNTSSNNSDITKKTGNNLKLPDAFKNINVQIMKNDNIIEYTQEKSNSSSTVLHIIKVKTDKSIDEIYNNYISQYSNAMFFDNNDSKVIITGPSNSLLKFIITKNLYTIYLETR